MQTWHSFQPESISKINFVQLTPADKDLNPNLTKSTRKADVTMRDGTVSNGIFLELKGVEWYSNTDGGFLYDARVKGINVDSSTTSKEASKSKK